MRASFLREQFAIWFDISVSLFVKAGIDTN